MIKQCEHECQMRGANEVRLSVYAMNEAGLGLYRSLGYDINSYSLKKESQPYGLNNESPTNLRPLHGTSTCSRRCSLCRVFVSPLTVNL